MGKVTQIANLIGKYWKQWNVSFLWIKSSHVLHWSCVVSFLRLLLAVSGHLRGLRCDALWHFCFLFMICLICTEMCLWTSLDFWFVSILRFLAEVLLSVHVPGDAPSGRSPIAYIAFVLACILVRSDFWDDVPISMARWNSAQCARYVILYIYIYTYI